MKRLIPLLIAVSFFFGCSKAPTPITKTVEPPKEEPFQPLVYQTEFDCPGLSSSEIIRRANKYVIETYTDYKTVVQYKDSTILALNALLTVYYPPFGYMDRKENIKYQLIFDAKPERCRITLSRFATEDSPVPTKEVEVKNLMHSEKDLNIRNKLQERINLKYRTLNLNYQSISTDLTDILQDPNYDNW